MQRGAGAGAAARLGGWPARVARRASRRMLLTRAVGGSGVVARLRLRCGLWHAAARAGADSVCGAAGRPGARGLAMKIYTKTGDKGTSQLFNGERRDKDDEVFQALGAVDECNAMIGLACEYSGELSELAAQLEDIMSRMFDVGASVATPLESSSKAKLGRAHFDASHTPRLERWIDAMDEQLPPLTTFILPSGGKCAAHLHVARTLARRAERHVTPLVKSGSTDPEVGKFLNRLSDYLFMAARFAAKQQGFTERTWKKVDAEAASAAAAAAAAGAVPPAPAGAGAGA